MKIFVSSTFEDLQIHRKKVFKVLEGLSHGINAMEFWYADPSNTLGKSLSQIEESDVYLCIIAFRYGTLTDDGKSFTYKEYLHAKKNNLKCLIFIISDDATVFSKHIDKGEKANKLYEFRTELEKNHTCCYFDDAEDLAKKVKSSVINYLITNKIFVPKDIDNYNKNLLKISEKVEPEDLKFEFDINKTVLELIDEVYSNLDWFENAKEDLIKSNDLLYTDLQAFFDKLKIDENVLSSIPYYENPFVNRNWELLNIGLNNFAIGLTGLILQIQLKYLELLSETKYWKEENFEQLINIRKKFENHIKNTLYYD
ncbi:MAG: DUF4062 domain-containing protein [Candidatus Latescibacteria bacterium]|nr:DUF4062 domain-containing protein [Candidatus Latescibacterota bacterium]